MIDNANFYSSADGYEITEAQLGNALSDVMRRVYGLMSIGLVLTAMSAWFIFQSGLVLTIVSNSLFFFGLILAQLALVYGVSAAINRLGPGLSMALFLLYSAINGITISTIFLTYTYGSIAMVFAVTAAMFGFMSIIGFTTKTDMSKYRSFFMMGLIGFIVASLANFWLQNPIMYWGLTYFGIALFLGLTVYDTQKIKGMTYSAAMQNGGKVESTLASKIAIGGALSLYLDFINLFILLMRVLGRRR